MLTFTPVLRAFRFYADGTESGSSPLEAENTNHTTPMLSASNYVFHIRVSINETGGTDGAAGDDWVLQTSKNGGVWDTPASGLSFTNASLTDGSATTNRGTDGISDPSGTFVAGVQKEAASLANHQLTTSNFTEHVWSMLVISNVVVNGDYFEFRVALNGGTPGMTHSFTPRLTVKKPHALASTNGTASLSGTSTGLTNHQASATSSSSLSGTATGYNLVPISATSASQVDGTSTGFPLKVLQATSVQTSPTSTTNTTANGTSHSITLPTHAAGDRLVLIGNTSPSFTVSIESSTGTWTAIHTPGTRFLWERIVTGSGETITLNTTSSTSVYYIVYNIPAAYHDKNLGGEYATTSISSQTSFNFATINPAYDASCFVILGLVSGSLPPANIVSVPPGYVYGINATKVETITSSFGVPLGSSTPGPMVYDSAYSGTGWTICFPGNANCSASFSGTATGEVVTSGTTHPLASTAGTAQVDGTSTGTTVHPLESTAASQIDGTSTGTKVHPVDSTSASQVDGTATGSVVIIHPLASTNGIAQLDGTSTGGAVLDLASTAASSASGTSTGVLLFDLGSTASAQLDGTSTGTCVHPLAASSGTAQVDGTATGSALVIHQVSSTSAAQIDGTSTGVVKFALEGTGDASVSGTSTGVTLYSIASTAASSFSGTSTGTAVLAVDSTSSSSVSGTSTGTNVKPVASSSSASQLDGTSTGVVVKPLEASSASSVSGTSTGTRVTPVASTSASSVSGTSTGTNIHPLAATSADSVDGTATGEVVITLIQQISATASSVLDGMCNGGFQFKIDASLASQVDVLSTGTRVQYISNYLEI